MESVEAMMGVEVESQVCGIELEDNLLSVTTEFEHQVGVNGIEDNLQDNMIIPFDGDSNIEPCLGLEFETEEAAYAFYSEYARRVGFFIRKKSTRYSRRDKTLIATQYVCSKEGYKRSCETVKNPRANTREGCRAMIRVKKMDSGKWVVHVVEKDHNHALVGPINVYYLQTARNKLGSEPHTGATKIEENYVDEEPAGLEDVKVELFVGMEFESEESSFLFYKEYARRVGFGIRKRSTRYSKRSRTLIATQYVCSKEGFKQINETVKHPRPNTREGCKAMVKVKRIESGKWVIHFVEKEHSHDLESPNNMQIVGSYRKLQPVANKVQLNQSLALALRPKKTRSSGVSNNHVTEQDKENYSCQMRELTFARGDVKALIEYFIRKQSENPSFFYAVEIDGEEHIRNVVWVDPKSRMAYTHFGDVVTFDTTYVTNKYQVPFAPFVGVNHHGQSVLLGCALLTDQTVSSITWVFQTWLAAMSGHQPRSIITEQDGALQSAVAKVFPGTHHCFSMWHIQEEVLYKLSQSCSVKGNFREEFDKCVYQTDTTDEFDSKWASLLHKFDLGENEWLQLFYEDRRHWVPVYLNDSFLAGLSTTEQNENLGSFFDGFVRAKASIKEFIDQYDIALQSQYEKECFADAETFNTKPCFMTASPLEKHAADVYTAEIFKKFQYEICQTLGYCALKTKEDGETITYMVRKFGEIKTYTVALNLSEVRVSCSCHMFEFTGILCRHALRVFILASIFTIPPPYILTRWTKNPWNGLVLNDLPSKAQGIGAEGMVCRYNDLCKKSLKMAEVGALSAEAYNMALHALQDSLEKAIAASDSLAWSAQPDTLATNHQSNVSLANLVVNNDIEGQPPSKKLKTEFTKCPLRTSTRTCSACKNCTHNICICEEPIESIEMERLNLPLSVSASKSSSEDNISNG
ncbi:protein FAR1-RELATED SEQUENCE 5-like [Aristolochia californica]|uniref:protein FAR1-RELATED SEQUENCE 5-like n=1 Tax=Aristolochia californica TaxID=171875 RepID=UPI0035E0E66D